MSEDNSNKSLRLERIANIINAWFNILSKIAIIVIIICIISIFKQLINNDSFILDKIRLINLKDVNIDEVEITNQLFDKIKRINFIANSLKSTNEIKSIDENDGLNIKLPNIEGTFQSLIEYIKIGLNRKTKYLSGSIYQLDSNIVIKLRISNDTTITQTRKISNNINLTIDSLLYDLAIHVQTKNDPYILSKYYYEIHDYSKAIEIIKKIKRQNLDYWTYGLWANCLREQGFYEKSFDMYQRCLVKKSDFIHGWYQWGNALYLYSDYSNAILKYHNAIKIDSTFSSAYIGIAKSYERKGDIDLFYLYLEKGIKNNYSIISFENDSVISKHSNERKFNLLVEKYKIDE